MNAFERKTQNEDMVATDSKLVAIRQSCMVIQAKVAELVALRQAWIDRVTAGTYDQADVDALNAYVNAAALNALKTGVDTYMATL